MELININNYKDHIGKEVKVEILCSEYGMAYPDNNILVGMNPTTFYFYSKEEDLYWDWPNDDDNDCSIDIWLKS